MITVESDHEKCLNLTAQDYLNSLSSKKKEQSLELPFQDVLLITGTNKDKDALNNIIRPELVKKGFVSDSKEFTVFQTKSLAGTGAMAADSYSVGQAIVTNKKCGIIPQGTQADIIGVNLTDNSLKVRFWDKEEMNFISTTINVRKDCKKFSTYDQEKKAFGVGDLILFLKNDKKVIGVNNGETARILSIDENGNVRARLESSENKKEVSFNINNKGPKAYNYISHAYAITDYKSQGATTERLLWFAPTKSGKMTSNTFYVAITRCKKEVGVYTDNVYDLREMVKKEQQKESVLDYPRPEPVRVETIKEVSQNNISEYKNPFFIEKAVKSVQDFYKEYVASIFAPKEEKNIENDKEKISI